MVSSISGNSDYLQQFIANMMSKMSSSSNTAAKGISKEDISSVAQNSNDGFVKCLSNNFDKFDSDGDGNLTASEISSALPPPPPMGPPPGMIDLFQSDSDGTTGLSMKELSSIDTSNDPGKAHFINDMKNNFDKIDTNKDGQITSDEIKATRPDKIESKDSTSKASTTDSSKDLLSAIDSNGDGNISIDELLKYLETDSKTSENTNNGNSSNNSQVENKFSDYFKKLLSSGYSNDFSTIVNSLNVAV